MLNQNQKNKLYKAIEEGQNLANLYIASTAKKSDVIDFVKDLYEKTRLLAGSAEYEEAVVQAPVLKSELLVELANYKNVESIIDKVIGDFIKKNKDLNRDAVRDAVVLTYGLVYPGQVRHFVMTGSMSQSIDNEKR